MTSPRRDQTRRNQTFVAISSVSHRTTQRRRISGETIAHRRTFPPHGHSRKSLKAGILSDKRRSEDSFIGRTPAQVKTHRDLPILLPARLHSGVLPYTNLDRMFPPYLGLADGRQESIRDRWVQQQMDEAMRHLLADLEVLPSPLLLEQMEREGVQRRSLPAPLVAHPDLSEKPTSSSRHKKRRRRAPSCFSAGEEESPMAAAVMSGAMVSLPADMRTAASIPASSSATALSPRLAAAPPMPSSHSPAQDSVVTPEELDELFKIKSFRRTSLLYSSPELIEKIRQMEEDYQTAIRQFYCRPPPSPPSLQRAASQPTSGLQSSAAAEQPTPGLQGAATEQPTAGLQVAAAEQPMPGLQSAAAAQPSPRLQSAAIVPPKSASTSSTRHRGRQKRDASAQVIGGSGDASTPATPPRVAATPQPLLKPLRVPATPQPLLKPLRVPATPQPLLKPQMVPATPQPLLKPLSVSATPQLLRFEDEPVPEHAPERFKKELVLVLASESRDGGFEEEVPPDPVSEGFKEQLVLVLVSEGPVGVASASASGGSPGTITSSFAAGLLTTSSFAAGLWATMVSTPLSVSSSLAPPSTVPTPLSASTPSLSAAQDSVLQLGDDLVARLNFVPARDDVLVARLTFVPARDEGFEEEVPPDPVSEGFMEQLVLILASEGPPDSASVSEGPVGAASVSEGPVGAASASKGPIGAASASEGSPGSASASEGSPGSASASDGSPGTVKAKPDSMPDSKPPEFHRVPGGSFSAQQTS
ncbi:hypothetical protein CRENBAI_006795 [Crenichthys baileyi]|uniref:Uncharacterized protein n=1 Tax=Crenichthys baileyi TaxID=28760 RepID=A0AAV9RUS7_9TELE